MQAEVFSGIAGSTMESSDSLQKEAVQAHSLSSAPKISIVINNYNYGQFLLRAIDSVLAQEDDNFDVIVVDDGSTDNSVAIARSRISAKLRVIEKANGGQASAINAGFAASAGEWVMFLDADDWYAPDALRTLRMEFQPNVAKIHFPLKVYYESKHEYGEIYPRRLSRGDVVKEVAETGNYLWPPTSGNLFNREALDKMMPIPEGPYRICADVYLCVLVAAHGTIAAVDRPLGFYCVHGENAYAQATFHLKRKYLYSQSMGLLRVTMVARQLLGEKGVAEKMTVLDRREIIEVVAMAARFKAIRLEDFGYSSQQVSEHWAKAYRNSPKTIRSRVPARCIWLIINCAPFAIVRMVMGLLASFRTKRFTRTFEER